MKPLVLISPWFGRWPPWINFFLESCRANREVDWLITTDQPPPENQPPNVRFPHIGFNDYLVDYGKFLRLDLSHLKPYKLCDLKPSLGAFHAKEIANYHSFGFCDIDVIFGNIRHFYDDQTLARYDVLSTRPRSDISGHLAVFRNTLLMRNAYRLIPRWREATLDERIKSVDERKLGKLLNPQSPRLFEATLRRLVGIRVLFEERYSTPGRNRKWPDGGLSPLRWTWKAGTLRHERQRESESLYLHFMHWKGDRGRAGWEPAPWPRLQSIVHCDWREAAEKGFVVSPEGIHLT